MGNGVRIFPNKEVALRLMGVVRMEKDKGRRPLHRYFGLG